MCFCHDFVGVRPLFRFFLFFANEDCLGFLNCPTKKAAAVAWAFDGTKTTSPSAVVTGIELFFPDGAITLGEGNACSDVPHSDDILE